ncbi:curli biogenesis system outer membrane secretion channel CsgG, partial [Janthinobacterium sp. CG_23.3]|uniref:CsgG/HfaB family protein n=1 Tax=Janthinobacterium sp. CG_23.3 TaxID=3349634 RepID=UPI0038D434D4
AGRFWWHARMMRYPRFVYNNFLRCTLRLNSHGADFVVTGDVTEFGRKEVGDHQLFGILGRGKTQVAYAKVTLNIVNINTSEVVYSSQGAGEYSLSNREIIGFGGTASYDATLNGKVLDLAVREAVTRLVEGMQAGAWASK